MGVAALAALVPVPVGAAPKAVVELFTSEGCSSCPPADAFLADLTRRPDVLAVSLHVNYWNYLGWVDTLASRANSDRQADYARARGDRRIYTPQMIVGGAGHFIGSCR